MLLETVNPLNASEYIFPTLEVFHIAGFAILTGTIAVVDFNLLGVGLRSRSAAEINKALAPWTLIGLALVMLSGPLMFSSDPDMYYLNYAFNAKMVLLLLAIVFQYTIHRKAVNTGASYGKVVALVSLTLWATVIAGGIFIAFI